MRPAKRIGPRNTSRRSSISWCAPVNVPWASIPPPRCDGSRQPKSWPERITSSARTSCSGSPRPPTRPLIEESIALLEQHEPTPALVDGLTERGVYQFYALQVAESIETFD